MNAFARAFAGTGVLVRLILRRDRVVMPLWVLTLAVLPVMIASTMNDLYPTAAERQSYIDIVTSTPAFLALYGHAFGHNLGAVTAWRLGGTVLFVGLASLRLHATSAGRVTRAAYAPVAARASPK